MTKLSLSISCVRIMTPMFILSTCPSIMTVLAAAVIVIRLACGAKVMASTDEFRDLICYQCTGADCSAYDYPYSVRHLVPGCQACYKQWHPHETDATRECFHPDTLTEIKQSTNLTHTELDTCGVIEEINSTLLNYCLCYEDFCNSSIRPSITPVSTYITVIVTAFISLTDFTQYTCESVCFPYYS